MYIYMINSYGLAYDGWRGIKIQPTPFFRKNCDILAKPKISKKTSMNITVLLWTNLDNYWKNVFCKKCCLYLFTTT